MSVEIRYDIFFSHNQSYCDWRVTFSCEDQIYKLLHISNLFVVLLIAIACIILLWYRISRQGGTIFSPKIPEAGFIRPNPIEGFLIWMLLWTIGRILFIITLWSGKFKHNYLILETLQVYWAWGTTGCAWFVVGTYLQIGNHLNSSQRPWRPNNKLSDIYLVIMTIITPIIIWPFAIASGYFRDNKNVKIADTLISIKYMLWGLLCGFGALGTFYFCRELCNVLSYRISIAKENSNSDHNTAGRVERMQSGLGKIRFTLFVIFIVYLYFVIYCLITSVFRVWILTHSKSLNIFLCITYSFFNPLCVILIVATISIRIIQSRKKESSTPTFIREEDDDNNESNANVHLAISVNANDINHLTQEMPDIIDQFEDLVAYTQFSDIKIQTVEEISGSSGSVPDFNRLNNEKSGYF